MLTSYSTVNNRYNTRKRAIYVSYTFAILNNVHIHVYVVNVYETFHPVNVNSTKDDSMPKELKSKKKK